MGDNAMSCLRRSAHNVNDIASHTILNQNYASVKHGDDILYIAIYSWGVRLPNYNRYIF
jgi:hypothetical protein